MHILDLQGTRTLRVDKKSCPTSIYLIGPLGWEMEFDRASFIADIARHFDLLPAGLLDVEFFRAGVPDTL
jgi:hypothetical protein